MYVLNKIVGGMLNPISIALLFVLVGALVIYATVSKMVDEQRRQIGTTKALGFFNREIMAKYLLFGVSATLLGMLLGGLLYLLPLRRAGRALAEGIAALFAFICRIILKPLCILWKTLRK